MFVIDSSFSENRDPFERKEDAVGYIVIESKKGTFKYIVLEGKDGKIKLLRTGASPERILRKGGEDQ
jgi:CTP:phosphocholine cytidylyltransferase-like protein